MPVWLTILSAGLKIIGLADTAERLINNWLQRQQGKAELRDEIDRATAESAQKQAEIFAEPTHSIADNLERLQRLSDSDKDSGNIA